MPQNEHRATSRVLDILEMLSSSNDGYTLTEIAKQIKAPKSSIFPIIHTLEDRQIYVSAGSACSSNKPAISSTLKSIGLKPSLLDSTIRFSFCVNTTQEEIDYAVSVMAEVIPMLRRYTRR